jgi:P pilus assembly chaperone PapD
MLGKIPAALAMSVEPLVLDMESLGKGAGHSFKVGNDTALPLPVEISVSRLEIDENGELDYQPAEEEFLVFPPQAIIAEGTAQTFRLQWLGESDIAASRTYRVAVTQIPVKQPDNTSGIQISMSFGVIVNVAPLSGRSAITMSEVKPAKTKDGGPAIALNVKNTGNKHAYLRDAALSLSAGTWSQKLTAYEVGQKVGLGIVQPGKERRFLIPMDVPPGVSDITASIDYQPEK